MNTQLSKAADSPAIRNAETATPTPPPEWAALSDRGRQRENNEDSWGAFALGAQLAPLDSARPTWPANGFLFLLSDGMGGARAGEEASRFCVVQLAAELHRRAASPDPRAAMNEAFLATHDALVARGRGRAEFNGMGATLSALWLRLAGEVVIGHVGDSRVYGRSGGTWRQLTDDHSLGEGLVRRGQMTAEAASHFRFRSLLEQVMGGDGRVIEPQIISASHGAIDACALCSDGLHRPLEHGFETRLAAALQQSDPAAAVRLLVDAANAVGGPDNITLVLVRPALPERT